MPKLLIDFGIDQVFEVAIRALYCHWPVKRSIDIIAILKPMHAAVVDIRRCLDSQTLALLLKEHVKNV